MRKDGQTDRQTDRQNEANSRFSQIFRTRLNTNVGRTKGREASHNYIMCDKRETEVTGQKLLKHFGVIQTSYLATGSHFNRIH